MRHGKLPRLRPPRVESWRARRGGLEGAGKSGMAWPDFDDHQPTAQIPKVRVRRGLILMIINYSLPSPARSRRLRGGQGAST